MTTTFVVEVDWTKTATWVDETAYVKHVQMRVGFEANEQPVAGIGTCRIVLDNSTRRFSPDYEAGALHGSLLPRREVRVSATSGGDSWVIFRGFIERIAPDAGELGGGECVVDCVDGLAILQRQRAGAALEDSKAVDEAVSDVVRLAYIPSGEDYADNGDSLFHYGRSWLPEQTSTAEALRQVCDAVYGRFYVARDGTATFLSRDNRLDASAPAALKVGADLYWERVRDAEPGHLVGLWRMNESTGTTVIDSSGNGFDGAYAGVTLAGTTGPDGEAAALLDGVNDYASLHGAGLIAALGTFTDFTLMMWLRVPDGSYWTDGDARYIALLWGGDANNYMAFYKTTNDNELRFFYLADGGVFFDVTIPVDLTGWFCVAVKLGADGLGLKAFLNGVQVDEYFGISSWGGWPLSVFNVGAGLAGPYWAGGMALVTLWDTALNSTILADLASV